MATFSVRSLCPEGATYHSPGLRRQPLPWVCRTRGTTLKGLRRCLDVSAFPDATPLGLGRGVVLTQGSRFATTLGYDTQPLRGKEGNSSVAACCAMLSWGKNLSVKLKASPTRSRSAWTSVRDARLSLQDSPLRLRVLRLALFRGERPRRPLMPLPASTPFPRHQRSAPGGGMKILIKKARRGS
ncbi:MAG: hypothetical protein BECKG1743F_GA0114225_101856 [Candidatus Kentron sp. G]|nr:MAG: hypothetical protein BECKG1743F_GA0114225_101856 [Candidatus Kentron sp. G]